MSTINLNDLPTVFNPDDVIVDIIDESIQKKDPKEKEEAIRAIKDKESDHIQAIKK